MPPKSTKRKREIGEGLAHEEEAERRIRRQQARENSLAHGLMARQATGRQNRAGMRGIRREDARSAEAFVGHVENKRHDTQIIARRRDLMRVIARSRASDNMGAVALHERMLTQLVHRMHNPGMFMWDDEGKDFVARHHGDAPGNFF